MNIDPNSCKYTIRANFQASGVVDRPDVVGAIFGQTEGLLGDELDLRDLQKSGRMGRIEVAVRTEKGKSVGDIVIPSSMDQVESSIFAAALETVDRIGPCKAGLQVTAIEDVRAAKRTVIIDRARELLLTMVQDAREAGVNITDSVRQVIQTEEITTFGPNLPAGPNVATSDAVIIVEGRSDVLNLLKYGIKNAVAVEGTSVPKDIIELTKQRTITAFVDGDRGGELILRELFQRAEIDFVARAPHGFEVEQITLKQVMKCLRDKTSTAQFLELNKWARPGDDGKSDGKPKDDRQAGQEDDKPKRKRSRRGGRRRNKNRDDSDGRADDKPAAKPDDKPAAKPDDKPAVKPDDKGRPAPKGDKPDDRGDGSAKEQTAAQTAQAAEKARKAAANPLLAVLDELKEKDGKRARLLDDQQKVLDEMPISNLQSQLSDGAPKGTTTLVMDGIITQALVDLATDKGISTVVAEKKGPLPKAPVDLQLFTRADLS